MQDRKDSRPLWPPSEKAGAAAKVNGIRDGNPFRRPCCTAAPRVQSRLNKKHHNLTNKISSRSSYSRMPAPRTTPPCPERSSPSRTAVPSSPGPRTQRQKVAPLPTQNHISIKKKSNVPSLCTAPPRSHRPASRPIPSSHVRQVGIRLAIPSPQSPVLPGPKQARHRPARDFRGSGLVLGVPNMVHRGPGIAANASKQDQFGFVWEKHETTPAPLRRRFSIPAAKAAHALRS
jgi:hypothetical protein